MADYDYDLFTIGAGSGGVRASRVAAAYGARVAVAEEFRVGGTCVIRGCVPKKMLVYGAHFAEDLEDARHFGWEVGECKFDWIKLRDNVLGDVDRINGLSRTTTSTSSTNVRRSPARTRLRWRAARRRPPSTSSSAPARVRTSPRARATNTASRRTRRSTSMRSRSEC
jgi:pyruvate/2-oxoglutarate dehydrogenase complex dihydrolipoamide dehydrogenase (E3) component